MRRKRKDTVIDVLGVIVELLLAAVLIAAIIYKWPIEYPFGPVENVPPPPVEEVSSSEPEIPRAEELFFEEEEITLCNGESFEIRYSVPEGTVYDTITFSSDSTLVVELDENVVTGRFSGNTVVRGVLDNGTEAELEVTVLPQPKEVSFSRSEIVLLEGEKIELTCLTDLLGLNPMEITVGDQVSLSCGETEENEEGLLQTEIRLKAVSAGDTVLTASLYNGKKAECAISVKEKADSAYLDGFEVIYQWPDLPTGCEVTALTMAMRYQGFELTKTEMANNYLPYTWNFTADVRYYFLGHPTDKESAGCYAPCIVTTAENYLEAKNLSEEWTVLNLTGSDPEVLYDYVAKGTPVVVWVTSGMKVPYVNYYCYGEDGEVIPWMFPEHCAVLIGYDKENGTVQFADSEIGIINTSSIEHFEMIYEMMMEQAIVLVKN